MTGAGTVEDFVAGYDFDLDHLYELGLRYLLDGIAAESARRLSGGR